MPVHHGLLVLDAHRSPLDIFYTAIWLRKKHPSKKIFLPVAGYVLYVPGMKQIASYYARKYRLTYFPVYRRIELTPRNLLQKVLCAFYPSGLTSAVREKANAQFIEEGSIAIRTGQIVLVAPYGSPLDYGGKIKYGVRQLMKVGAPTLLTKSGFSPWRWKWTTTSCLLGSKHNGPEYPHQSLLAVFAEM